METCLNASTISDNNYPRGGFAMIDSQSQSTEFPNFMRRAAAADYIRTFYAIPCRHSTLAKWAVGGNGPRFRKAGKFPIYSRDDLDTWARSRLSEPVQSTSAFSVRSRRSRSG
jgi:hypothetical protein